MTTDYPDDADGDALRRVAAGGADMSKPMDIDFFIAASDEATAKDIAGKAAELGYRTEICFDNDERSDAPWACVCTKSMIPIHPALIAAQAELEALARPLGAYADGWGTFAGSDQYTTSGLGSEPVPPKPRIRLIRLTPDRFVIGLLVLECLLWLSSELGWSPMIWTFLVAVAVVGATLLGMLLSFLVCLVLRWRFQFSIRSLLVLTVAIAIPCSWWAVVMKRAWAQHAIVQAIYEQGGDIDWEINWQGEAPGPRWLQGLTANTFFMNAIGVYFAGDHVTVTDAGLEPLKGLPRLRTLQLDNTQVTDAGLGHIEGLNQLRGLSLNLTMVTDAGLEHLKGLTKIEGLYLAGTEVTDAGLVSLKALPNLQVLDLNGTKVTDAGLSRLIGQTKIEELYLAGTKVSDTGLVSLKGLPDLHVLNLDGTKVTDAGLAHLAGMTNLHRLWLDKTQITDAGLVHLKGLSRLQTLYLVETRITKEGVANLQKALPNCFILPERQTRPRNLRNGL